jgi:diguanylate cyclase (GGDEF)-like protein
MGGRVRTSQLRKRIVRSLKVSWRDQPNRYDIEAMQANIRRVGLVIRMRWALVATLAIYSVLAGWAYIERLPVGELAQLIRVPAAALLFVVFYNVFYLMTYKRLGNVAPLNHLQLLFDALVVSVIVFYSGGVNSWFWTMYALFVFEAAFILPRVRSAWLLAAACATLLGVVVWGQYLGLLPYHGIPFANPTLYQDGTFVAVRYLWQVTVLAGSASVSTVMMAALTSRERELSSSAIVDETTGLFNRPYFHRALASEIHRAQRDGRQVYVILADLYHFGEFNQRFGLDRGDRLLKDISVRLRNSVSSGEPMLSSNIVSRYGGEEFAIIVAEPLDPGTPCTAGGAYNAADLVRRVIAAALVDGVGVTASVGVACFPADGVSSDELLAAADEALSRAAEAGGDRAVAAGSLEA